MTKKKTRCSNGIEESPHLMNPLINLRRCLSKKKNIIIETAFWLNRAKALKKSD